MLTATKTLERESLGYAPAVTRCSCGTLTAPDGTCLEVGSCLTADAQATRGSRGATVKFAVPAAWNASGRVD